MNLPKLLDCVTLRRDLPEFGLRKGHIGTAVEVFGDEALMVEFMDEEGYTVALLTLSMGDVSVSSPHELSRRFYPQALSKGAEVPIADVLSEPSKTRRG